MFKRTFTIGILVVFVIGCFWLSSAKADDGIVYGETGVVISRNGKITGGGAQKNSYTLNVGPHVLADSYHIVFDVGVAQDVIDNVNAAAAKASRVTGSYISTNPGTYKITITSTQDDVCGNACAYWNYDPTLGVMVDSYISIENWSFPQQYAPCLAVHELGHTLGLGHYDDPRQIMNPIWTVGQSPCTWANGDLNGLNVVGF